jgi:hypothetical protein
VRTRAYVALVSSAVALAGCGGDDVTIWDGPPDPAADGSVATAGFVQYADDVDETWEGSPAASAAAFLRLDEREVSRTTIDEKQTGEGTGPATVLVTLDGLFDDSVRAERWTLSFEREDESYRLTAATWAQRCQDGRGHQTFTPEPCV